MWCRKNVKSYFWGIGEKDILLWSLSKSHFIDMLGVRLFSSPILHHLCFILNASSFILSSQPSILIPKSSILHASSSNLHSSSSILHPPSSIPFIILHSRSSSLHPPTSHLFCFASAVQFIYSKNRGLQRLGFQKCNRETHRHTHRGDFNHWGQFASGVSSSLVAKNRAKKIFPNICDFNTNFTVSRGKNWQYTFSVCWSLGSY